jgi:hypothetical protein
MARLVTKMERGRAYSYLLRTLLDRIQTRAMPVFAPSDSDSRPTGEDREAG